MSAELSSQLSVYRFSKGTEQQDFLYIVFIACSLLKCGCSNKTTFLTYNNVTTTNTQYRTSSIHWELK